MRELDDIYEANISLPALNAAYVVAVQVCQLCQLFL
jgi:hypothetical protein